MFLCFSSPPPFSCICFVCVYLFSPPSTHSFIPLFPLLLLSMLLPHPAFLLPPSVSLMSFFKTKPGSPSSLTHTLQSTNPSVKDLNKLKGWVRGALHQLLNRPGCSLTPECPQQHCCIPNTAAFFPPCTWWFTQALGWKNHFMKTFKAFSGSLGLETLRVGGGGGTFSFPSQKNIAFSNFFPWESGVLFSVYYKRPSWHTHCAAALCPDTGCG